MNAYEILLGGINLFIVVFTAVKQLRAPNRMLFWSPLLFYTFTWGYYSGVGPAMALILGQTFDRGRDMRDFLQPALLGGLISYLMTLAGYRLGRGHSNSMAISLRANELWSSERLGKRLVFIGAALMVLGFGMFCIAVGTNIFKMLNPFNVQGVGEGYGGAFGNYFGYGIQFFIPACVLLVLAVRRYSPAWIVFIPSLVLSLALYLQQGFRYRLVLLAGGLLTAYYLDRWKRPSGLIQAIWLFGAVLVMGFIGLTRDYGMGLKLDRLQGNGIAEMLQGGLGDSGIFFTSGAVLDLIPDNLPHVGIAPIKGALLMPIPSAIFKGKDTVGYSENLIQMIYGEGRSTGAAYMFFAEWYYAFGWIGLIGASLLLGYLMGRFWRWFLQHSDNLFAIVVYACLMPFSYVVLSRGYFSQVFMLFCFAAVPSYAVYRFNLRRPNGSTNAPRVTASGQVQAPRPQFPPRHLLRRREKTAGQI